jgi:putative MATE family efflux protein
MGITSGVGVAVATAIGKRDDASVRKTVHTAIPLSLVCGAIINILLILLAEPILKLMDSPSDIIGLSATYIKIYAFGMIPSMLYNFAAAILRAVGDTVRPLIFLTGSGIINVILNLIFVVGFGMDADGVAIATVASNIVSAIFVMNNLIRSTHACRINLKDIRILKKEFKRIISLGLPSGIQSAMFSVSNLVMQSSFNSFGSSFVAGNAAAANIDHYNDYLGTAFVQAATTFSGQNFGAGNYKRIKKIFIESILCVSSLALVVSSLIIIFREPLARLFISDNEYAIHIAGLRNIYVGGMYIFCAIMSVSSANIRAIGKSVCAMMVTVIVVCFGRVVWIYTVFAQFPGSPHVLYIVYPISWIVTSIINICMFIYFYRRMASGKMKMGV